MPPTTPSRAMRGGGTTWPDWGIHLVVETIFWFHPFAVGRNFSATDPGTPYSPASVRTLLVGRGRSRRRGLNSLQRIPPARFFMKSRGPEALIDRRNNPIVCPTVSGSPVARVEIIGLP